MSYTANGFRPKQKPRESRFSSLSFVLGLYADDLGHFGGIFVQFFD
jgi:hypothetical protein